jgi:hypothetical protein
MAGRTIKIFLVDGTPVGLRTIEVGLSTLKALVAPRSALEALSAREEAKRTGVYLLLGDDETSPGRVAVYVGEGDSVLDRITKHDAAKDFWHTVALFVSKDANLTKAHVRWLEARLVSLAESAKRAKLENLTRPEGGSLPEPDAADMDEVISQIRLILGAVGFDVFTPISSPTAHQPAPEGEPPATTFECAGDGYSAQMLVTPGGYLVPKGSRARKAEAPTLQSTYKNLRATLLSSGVLVETAESIEFTSDYVFNSPSAAACVVSGTTLSGGSGWRLRDGTTYKAWEQRESRESVTEEGQDR